MINFISGAVAMGCFAAGLFFARFWTKTRDSLFLIFAVSFWALGLERILQMSIAFRDDPRAFGVVIRLAAFTLILIAFIRKNREGKN